MKREEYIMKNIINILKKNKTDILISFIFAFVIALVLAANSYAQRVTENITQSVVRFHVLANSDSEHDQSIKLKVRDSVLEAIGEKVVLCSDREAAEKFLSENKELIKDVAEKTVKENGESYMVSVELSDEYYPVRYYENTEFPPGLYKSLRVIIGSGEGHNWWCVMYPPLCLNGEAVKQKNSEMLKNTLSNESYEIVVLSEENNKIPEFKFKVVELLSDLK